MKPILFAETATQFNTNGIGRLDCTECIVTEERNGLYQLELSIAESALHASEIGMSSIICAIPSDGANLQAFRVYKITKPINGIFKVYAQHISYQLSMIPTMPFSITASNHAAQDTLNGLVSNAAATCPFTFTTDVTTVNAYKQDVPASIRSRLGGVSGSVLDNFGGEYLWDNYDVYLKAHRGVQIPQVTLLYGKNITDLNQEENIANTSTGIVPYYKDENTIVTLPEKVVETSHATSFPFKRIVPMDFSDAWDEAPTELQLRTKAQAYVNQSGIGDPVVSIKVSFVQLSDTEEYKELAPLQHVKLCDVINVNFAKYDISVTAKVVKTVYDVLAERYDSIEVGSIRSNLATTITDAQNEAAQEIENKFAHIDQLVDNATAWLTSGDGYVVAIKDQYGQWQELLFMDTDDVDTAHNVLRINQNGIGFSSNGVGGPYTQAWTLDGRIVIGGTNVPSLTVYDNATPPNIIFQTSQSGTIWNSTNSSMTAAGVLTAVGAILQNAQISNKSGNYGTNIQGNRIAFTYQDNETASIEYEQSTWGSGYVSQSLEMDSDGDLTLRSGSRNSIHIAGGTQNYNYTYQGVYIHGKNIFLEVNGNNKRVGISGQYGPIQDFDVNISYDSAEYFVGNLSINFYYEEASWDTFYCPTSYSVSVSNVDRANNCFTAE